MSKKYLWSGFETMITARPSNPNALSFPIPAEILNIYNEKQDNIPLTVSKEGEYLRFEFSEVNRRETSGRKIKPHCDICGAENDPRKYLAGFICTDCINKIKKGR